jgi:hypothetical protein
VADVKKKMEDVARSLSELGATVVEEAGELVAQFAGDVLPDGGDRLLEELVMTASMAGRSVAGIAGGVRVGAPGSAPATPPPPQDVRAAVSSQLFELADVWRGLGLRVEVNDKGDLVFCRPVAGGKEEVCATVSGGLIRRLLRLGVGAVRSLIRRALGAVLGAVGGVR